MPYANLQFAALIFSITVFMMSWDYVPPVVKFLTRVSK